MINISDLVAKIRAAVVGVEVKGTIADGIAAINTVVEDNTIRQSTVEDKQTAVEVRQDLADSNEIIRQTNETGRKVAATTRTTEFNGIKTDYDSYKNVMIAESNVAALQNGINKNTSDLADIPSQNYNTYYINKTKIAENTDISDLLISLIANGNITIDLQNGTFIISKLIPITTKITIKNGTLKTTGVGGFNIIGQFNEIHDVTFIGEDIATGCCITISSPYNNLYRLRFEVVNIAIFVNCLAPYGVDGGAGIYDVNITDIHINYCRTGITMNNRAGWITDINVINVFIRFEHYGIILSRGDWANDIDARKQFSQCTFSHITLQDVHYDNNECVGLYVNAGWNNFDNIVFFADGVGASTFIAIKFDPCLEATYNWDLINGIRCNTFSNLFIEGKLLFNGLYHLNKIINMKIPASWNTGDKTNPQGFINTSNKIEALQKLDSTSLVDFNDYWKTHNAGILAGTVTCTKTNNSYVISNASAETQDLRIDVVLNDTLRNKLLASATSHVMFSFLIKDTSVGKALATTYIFNIDGNQYGRAVQKITTSKGIIFGGAFECGINDAMKAIIESTATAKAAIQMSIPAGETVTINDFKFYPYLVTILNDDNLEWQDGYID